MNMFEITAEVARKLSANNKIINRRLNIANNNAEIHIGYIIKDIKWTIEHTSQKFVGYNFSRIRNKLTIVQAVNTLRKLGFLLKSDSNFNKNFILKIYWNEIIDEDDFCSAYLYANLYLKYFYEYYTI